MGIKISKDSLFYGLRARMTSEQEDLVNAIYSDKNDIVFCNSKAGTGKTLMAVATAKLLIQEGQYKELLYVFNPTEENKMGYRPGSQEEKEKEYITPLRQALTQIGDNPDKAMIVTDINNSSMKKTNGKQWVRAESHTFARGTNQRNKVIIIDEAQNWTVGQLKKMLTRCHDNSKVIVIGHDGQIDLTNKDLSGFTSYYNHFMNMPRAKHCNLTVNFRGWLAQHADMK